MKIVSVYIHGKYHKAAGITHTVAVVDCLKNLPANPLPMTLIGYRLRVHVLQAHVASWRWTFTTYADQSNGSCNC